MVAAAGAGPNPIPFKQLNVGNLADALRFCLSEEASAAARTIAERMKNESGVRRAVTSFHANLPLQTMRCDIMPSQPAAWTLRDGSRDIKLCKEAAGNLVRTSRVRWKDLERRCFLYRC